MGPAYQAKKGSHNQKSPQAGVAHRSHTHLLRPPAPLLALVLEQRLRHGEDGREPDASAEEDDGAVQ